MAPCKCHLLGLPLESQNCACLCCLQEEVALMWAVMLKTDYITKPTFVKNFWAGFKEVRQ